MSIVAGLLLGIAGGAVAAQTGAGTLAPLPADARYASAMNEFLKADQKQMPPSGAVLFMGSSSIRMWTALGEGFPDIPVIIHGFGGSVISENTLYADRITIPYKPKIIVLYAGANDLAYGNRNPQQVLGDFKAFVAKIHGALPDTRIVYLSINPNVARWKLEHQFLEANHLIQSYIFANNSKTDKLDFIDAHAQFLSADDQPQPDLYRADGLHFNAAGYKLWTSIVKPRIMALAAMDGVERQ